MINLIKDEGLYQNKVSFSLLSTYNNNNDNNNNINNNKGLYSRF